MRRFIWMSRVTRKKNKYVKGSIEVASIMNKIRENRLRWFDHVTMVMEMLKRKRKIKEAVECN